MKKEKLYIILIITFTILTLLGAGYVLYNKGKVNAGYAVIPMLFDIIFVNLLITERNKQNKENNK